MGGNELTEPLERGDRFDFTDDDDIVEISIGGAHIYVARRDSTNNDATYLGSGGGEAAFLLHHDQDARTRNWHIINQSSSVNPTDITYIRFKRRLRPTVSGFYGQGGLSESLISAPIPGASGRGTTPSYVTIDGSNADEFIVFIDTGNTFSGQPVTTEALIPAAGIVNDRVINSNRFNRGTYTFSFRVVNGVVTGISPRVSNSAVRIIAVYKRERILTRGNFFSPKMTHAGLPPVSGRFSYTFPKGAKIAFHPGHIIDVSTTPTYSDTESRNSLAYQLEVPVDKISDRNVVIASSGSSLVLPEDWARARNLVIGVTAGSEERLNTIPIDYLFSRDAVQRIRISGTTDLAWNKATRTLSFSDTFGTTGIFTYARLQQENTQ